MPLSDAYLALARGRDGGPLALGITVQEQRRREASAPAPKLGIPGEALLSVEDLTVPGPQCSLTLRVYKPEAKADQQSSALLFLHGGGFVIGSLDSHDALCRAMAAAVPCIVIAVDYRRAPESLFPAAHDDCFAAAGWVADNLAHLGATEGRLAVAGDSAGGNLAAAVAYLAKEHGKPELALQVPIFPCLEARFVTGEEPRGTYQENAAQNLSRFFAQPADAQDPRYALLNADLTGVAPAFVLTAEVDPLRDEGLALANKLKASGVQTVYKLYEGTCHGFVQFPGTQCHDAIMDMASELRKAFGMV